MTMNMKILYTAFLKGKTISWSVLTEEGKKYHLTVCVHVFFSLVKSRSLRS